MSWHHHAHRQTSMQWIAGENSAPAREAGPPMTWLYRRSPMSWHHGAMPQQLPVLDHATAAVCCAPLASAPLSVDDARGLAGQLKALADPARLRLLSLMLANENFEACTCD